MEMSSCLKPFLAMKKDTQKNVASSNALAETLKKTPLVFAILLFALVCFINVYHLYAMYHMLHTSLERFQRVAEIETVSLNVAFYGDVILMYVKSLPLFTRAYLPKRLMTIFHKAPIVNILLFVFITLSLYVVENPQTITEDVLLVLKDLLLHYSVHECNSGFHHCKKLYRKLYPKKESDENE